MKITEAMSEIKLFNKKIQTQREFILRNMAREDRVRDPFEKDQTTQEAMVKGALQSISDLEKNIVAYRSAITKANMDQNLELEGTKMTIAEWLIWRREVLPIRKQLLTNLANNLARLPSEGSQRRNVNIRRMDDIESSPTNYVVNVSDKWLLAEIEKLDAIEQRLDGQLSMLNANVDVSV